VACGDPEGNQRANAMRLKNKSMIVLLKYLDHLKKDHPHSIKLKHLKCYLRKHFYYDTRSKK